ncbi:cation-translocating P-type ATPase [Lachnotalea glycerini]|uniref:Cation-translocating P-type ATPase n=1 Tax=Lachnotalea glycerini TaxID=1763509 RepID=A0A371JHF0_9FIRM|nr:cation-translocating P-type ATPase [Lachnotalea glycerini]RDY32136.1 cation-translocating P-type ATPase [Lachnotalea glycerini]
MSDIYLKEKQEVLRALGKGEIGLTTQEAKHIQREKGYNELIEKKKKSVLCIFLEQFKDFLVLILIAASVISAILGDIESAIVIGVVITINAILGTIQHQKAEKSLNSLKQLSAPNAKILRDGETKIIPSREVTVGDIVYLEAGDFICADGRIIDNASLKVNESALTGESLAVDKQDIEITKESPLGDRINMVYSGSFVTYGRAKFIVTEIGMDTEVGKIATLLKNTAERKTPLQVNLDQFGKKLSIVILLICVFLFAISVWKGEAVIKAFMFAVALAVAAIPEALSSIVTIVLAFGTQKMAKEHAIIRQLQAVEGLGSVSVVCSDKTGTLTQNKMTVINLFVSEINENVKNLTFDLPLERKLLAYSLLCNDASHIDGVKIGDPTEVALVDLAERGNNQGKMELGTVTQIREKYPRIYEIPFDSDRKLMSTVHQIEDKIIVITKGAVDVILEKASQIEFDDGVREITKKDKENILKTNLSYSTDGLRVLGFAYQEIAKEEIYNITEDNMTFLGMISMMDPPREESKAAVEECKMAGIRPIMITGDHKITAAAIAKQIGILGDKDKAVEGAEIDGLSDQDLIDYVENVSVYARVSPEHKIRIVKAWQDKGNIVAMTGDGVNDAPALKQADIGVAMGITGTEVAKDAASMVLTDDNFATIVKAVENGRNVYQNIKKSIQFLLSGNTAGIIAVIYASIAGLAVPFAPVHLLFINLLTDSLPAIALGLDPHSLGVMKEKPRDKDESILTKDFLMGILVEGFVIAIMTMSAYYVGLENSGEAAASTMAFATLCLSRLVHGFNSKSQKAIIFTKEIVNNKYLFGAFFVGFILLNTVLLVPELSGIFEVTALSSELLFTIYVLALANLFVIQVLKWVQNKIKAM